MASRSVVLAVSLLLPGAATAAQFHRGTTATGSASAPRGGRRAATVAVTLEPAKDGTLFEGDTLASNGAGEHLFSGMTARSADDFSRGSIRRALLAFDLSASVPAGATIESVTLTLHMSRTRAGPQNVSLHEVLSDWGEGTSDAPLTEGSGADPEPGDATWVHTFFPAEFWQQPGGDVAAEPSAQAEVNDLGSYTWGPTTTMVADVQGWLDVPESNFGWAVVGDESHTATAKRFDSRENATLENRPRLRIELRLPSAGGCAGDCNMDGAVDVDELVRGVAIVLDDLDLDSCPQLDGDGDGSATTAELIRAVWAALAGCAR